METRPFLSPDRPVSVLGLRVQTPVHAVAENRSAGPTLIGEARKLGISLFEIPANRPVWTARTFFECGPTITQNRTVILDVQREFGQEFGSENQNSSPLPPAFGSTADGTDSVRRPQDLHSIVDRLSRELRQPSIEAVTVPLAELTALASSGWMDALRDLQSRAKIAGWGTSVVSADAVENPNARRVLEEASFVSLPYHLLDTSVYDRVARSLVGGDAKVLVHNPYADGRLDGSFFRTNPFHVRNPPRPADWLEMQRWWEPITRLAFLTEGKKRSLAQAAIQFALSPPSVSSVILSEAEILSVRGSPTGIAGSPLSMEELGRIRSLLSRTPDPSPAVRPLDAHREA